MKIAFLLFGVFLQGVAIYIAFFSELVGDIYLATLVSVLSICCLITIRSLIAPVCLFAGILVGLSLSHNELDLQVLTDLEQQLQPIVQAEFEAIQDVWNSSVRLEYLTVDEGTHIAETSHADVSVKAAESTTADRQ